ncbi:MAG TPA: response regulator [Candidatus Binatia bacterium]|nr:response regulator [Candidatus Binatia bacterium]
MMKILIIENHADMREILVRILDLMGFTAITSRNGSEGVEKALAEKPDLILMDIMMPEISGWEATRILRDNPQTKDIPVLAATVLVRPSDLQRCITVGCNDYIVKPFTVGQLRRKIERLI